MPKKNKLDDYAVTDIQHHLEAARSSLIDARFRLRRYFKKTDDVRVFLGESELALERCLSAAKNVFRKKA